MMELAPDPTWKTPARKVVMVRWSSAGEEAVSTISSIYRSK
jgi:hypothetical protein